MSYGTRSEYERRRARQRREELLRRNQRYEPSGCFPLDVLHGYLFFSSRASCYVVGGCAALLLPGLLCGIVAYFTFA